MFNAMSDILGPRSPRQPSNGLGMLSIPSQIYDPAPWPFSRVHRNL